MARIVIIGGGIIGAVLALQLSRQKAQVTVLDASAPAQGATAASFGWINASFFLDHDHFLLREAGIAAWHRLNTVAGPLPISWQGCLWWEETGAAFERFQAQLEALGYPSEPLDAQAFSASVPGIGPTPEQALLLPSEGAAESGDVTRHVLARAAALGAEVYSGVRVQAIEEVGGEVRAVRTEVGRIEADRVVVAAGTGVAPLLAPFGVDLSMLRRPGVSILTQPVPQILKHVMVAPGQEFRQLPDGRILAPTSANHQSDQTSDLTQSLPDLAGQTMARLRHLMPDQALALHSTALAMRPVPGDGRPVIGPAGPEGLYVSVMHSGITLAAIVAELAAREICDQEDQAMLTPYRPARFV